MPVIRFKKKKWPLVMVSMCLNQTKHTEYPSPACPFVSLNPFHSFSVSLSLIFLISKLNYTCRSVSSLASLWICKGASSPSHIDLKLRKVDSGDAHIQFFYMEVVHWLLCGWHQQLSMLWILCTYSVLLYGSGALVAVWLASAIVNAVDSIPLVVCCC
ncbi:uncharacterized protein LOC123199080 [Mangifera indica]|uniref:uncharacterized protein LOC123199080 n=1 Tax=Mangifera indica TaxID=29780 RepID=UPI001CFC3275|nr:uncharacterized protein LOC123199080 [Mangifera indica]